jgi:hypothetical protein
MSLQSFVSEKTKTSLPKSDSMITDFAIGKTRAEEIVTSAQGKKPGKIGTAWNWLSKQLMKPVGTVAAEVESLGKFFATGKPQKPGQAGWEVLSGQREYSFGQLWSEYGNKMGINPKVSGSIGFTLDIVADPLNMIGGGLTRLGKIAQKVSSLKKSGKTIKEGSKLAKTISQYGWSVDDLALAGTKVEQVAKGQRALITAMGRPIVGGSKYYKATERLGQIARASKVGSGFTRTFSTKTGIKYLDEAADNFKNLSEYRKQQVVDKAMDIQKEINKMSPEDVKMIAEVIERPEIITNIKNKGVVGLANKIDDLFKDIKVTEKAKGVLKTELDQYFPHIKAKESLTSRINHFFNPKTYSTTLGAAKQRKISGTVAEINARFGKEFFQTNPAVAYAQRGLASAKAVTAKEFLDDIGKKFFVNAEDAPLRFMESTNPLFKGLKAEPEVVRAVDQYVQGIKPDDLKLIIRGFDRVQNWWKGQVLISPSYHIRNMVGNYWNNFLAGVKDPTRYENAMELQLGKKGRKVITEAGETITGKTILKEANKRGVLGQGWYGADIAQTLQQEVGGISKLKKLLPWEQQNYAFKFNRKVGEVIENNARLAHFIDKVAKGFSYDDAARSVKTFLFDYSDLTPTEKNVFKRLFPFYTWSRKNLPLQLENLALQPEKFAAVPKIIERIESGVAEPRDEKYMSSYISENVPVRIRTNEKGDTEYFLLGNWLPSAQAVDLLSNPFENLVNMVTPLAKTPFELWANKSFYFKNTLGEPSQIEYYYKQPTEFIGIDMRRKTAHLLRNIRVLNDINKLVETPAKDEPDNSNMVRFLNVLFGKAATYDIKSSKYFYERDTQQRITELEAAIKKSKREGSREKVKQLTEELKQFKKER